MPRLLGKSRTGVFIGWSKERYDKYIETHVFYKDYDLSPSLGNSTKENLAIGEKRGTTHLG